MILAIIYIVLGYWVTGKTTHTNKIFMGYGIGELFFERLILGFILGWALIPVTIIRIIWNLGLIKYLHIDIFVLD